MLVHFVICPIFRAKNETAIPGLELKDAFVKERTPGAAAFLICFCDSALCLYQRNCF